MKLIFVIGTLQAGGAERVVSILTKELLDYGYDITIVCYYKAPIFYDIDERIEILNIEDYIPSFSIFNKIKWFRNYINKTNPDVVISFMNPFYLFTLFSLQKTKFPIIISDRNDPIKYSFIRKLLTKLLIKRASRIIVQTNKIKKYYSIKVQNKISIIYNPVDDRFETGIALTTLKEPVICAVGRLTKQKNYQLLINGFSKIHNKHHEFQLKIYGEGELMNDLSDLINNLNMESNILLMGKSDNIKDELIKSSLFIMTSDYEGMSNSLIEAICLGLPIISTKVSGANELIKSNINGILIDVGSETQLIESIDKLLSNSEYANRLACNVVESAKLFNKKFIVEQWNKEITSLIKPR